MCIRPRGVVVMLSESTQLCLPPRPLTSAEGYIGKVSEEAGEAFPNPRRCPYTTLKKETKQKTTQVKQCEIVGFKDSCSPHASSEIRPHNPQFGASPSPLCLSLFHLQSADEDNGMALHAHVAPRGALVKVP